MAIMIKTTQEIEKMRRSGLMLREVHDAIRPLVVAGATTMDLGRSPPMRRSTRSGRRLRSRGITGFLLRSARR